MPANDSIIKQWIPMIGLHALHQVEESISFFQWYLDNAAKIPPWLLILNIKNADRAVQHPGYFIVASMVQISFVITVAYIFRNHERVSRTLMFIYLLGLAFFFIWHIMTSYLAHSYAPVLVTCLAGLYLIPVWIYRLFRLNNHN